MMRATGCLVGLALALLSCSGEEFASRASGGAPGAGALAGSGGSAAGAGGAAGNGTGGATTGGTSGGGGSGGAATGGSGGAVTGGSGGTATGGTGGVTIPPWDHCGKLGSPPPLLYSTLNDLSAITGPDTGAGPGSAVPGDAFQLAKCENGIALDSANEHVAFPLSGNLNFAKGTIDFWYVPKAAETDGAVHNLFATSGFPLAGEGGIKIRKAAAGNGNELAVHLTDPAGLVFTTSVAEADYSFAPNTPVRITVAWNLTNPSGAPAASIYLDKVEPAKYLKRAKLPITTPIGNASGKIFVGAETATDPTPANGLIDDFKIYGATLQPK